ncbi:MAG: hypothetical protein J0L84_06865 [Verrucomicrobia bacterium]|nr:hypothetical protein [Verrucomicrobiota bacterium]
MSALGVARGQVVAVAAFQEGASDDWAVDWIESAILTLDGPDQPVAAVSDPADLGDRSGDVRRISAHVVGDELHLSLTVEGLAAPSVENTQEEKVNRYYYHWLLDTDNNPATGRSNSEYEGTPTGLSKPIGAERVVMVGWRDGKPNGVELYDPLNEDTALLGHFAYHASGNTLTAVIPLEPAGLAQGQSIALSAFQEGASDDWSVDWLESAPLTVDAGEASDAPVAVVDDPVDMADPNGDIRRIEATVVDGKLVLRMTVQGAVLPAVEQTAEGMVNRHYYHWLLDTDNNPATGRSNSEYEGNPTGLSRPVGSERVIMVGWRNGDFDGREVYDPLNEDVALVEDFEVNRNGATMEVRIPLADLGLTLGQTLAVSAFQEGASDGWAVDWIESAELTLSEGALPGIDLTTTFDGNAYGFTARIEDAGAKQADPSTVTAALDGNPAVVQVSKTAGVTTVTGVHATLLAPNTTHTLKLSVAVSGELQSRDFVFPVGSYTVLPTSGRLTTVDPANPGFLAYVTQISADQIGTGERDAYQGRADLAEKQLLGELAPEGLPPYFNEADPAGGGWWKGAGVVVPGVVNWFELPGESASLNFPNDEPIPNLFAATSDGMVVEILTYLELSQGSHKLGVYSEGGHQASAGLSPGGALLSLFDNSGETPRIPTYFARNQFFDVIAPEAGYYPLRMLWLQNRRDQERGAILELFSVQDRTLHLLNAPSDPLAIKAYRAGVLLTPGVDPLQLSVSPDSTAGVLKVTWTGGTPPFTVRQRASLLGGAWTDLATTSERVASIPLTGDSVFIEVVGQ